MSMPPAAIGSRPAIARNTLVLPEPDAPMIVTLSPRATANEIPCTTARAPRVTSRSATSRTATVFVAPVTIFDVWSRRPRFLGLGARSVLSPFVLGASWTRNQGPGTDQDPSTKDQR